jgi:hypothetical protein
MSFTARQEFILPIIRRAAASRSALMFVHYVYSNVTTL